MATAILRIITTTIELSLRLLLVVARCHLTTTTLSQHSYDIWGKIIYKVSNFKVVKEMDASLSFWQWIMMEFCTLSTS
jgi:hypothetical protein